MKPVQIKKANRGKFSSMCKSKKMSMSKCAAKMKNSKNATTRKRATFAQNAKKWKKGKK